MSVKRMKLRLKIHPAGAVLAALGLMLFPSAGMLAAAAAMLLHEGGHVLAMTLCRVKECRIELTPSVAWRTCRVLSACRAGSNA